MRNYTLDDFRRIIDKLTSTPEIFRKNFDNLYDFLYENDIEYYKSFEDFMEDNRDSTSLDVLLRSLKEFPKENIQLSKGDTLCPCYVFDGYVHSFEKEEDAIESIRKLIDKKRTIEYLIKNTRLENSVNIFTEFFNYIQIHNYRSQKF